MKFSWFTSWCWSITVTVSHFFGPEQPLHLQEETKQHVFTIIKLDLRRRVSFESSTIILRHYYEMKWERRSNFFALIGIFRHGTNNTFIRSGISPKERGEGLSVIPFYWLNKSHVLFRCCREWGVRDGSCTFQIHEKCHTKKIAQKKNEKSYLRTTFSLQKITTSLTCVCFGKATS